MEKVLDKNVMYSDEHKEGSGACSAYSPKDGKCLLESGKYCDLCASEYENTDY